MSVRRVELMDATFDMIRQQRNLLPIDLPDGYVEQMQANIRVTEKDELGKVKTYYRATGHDDYAQAEVYDMVAAEVWRVRQAVVESQREVFQPLDEMMEFQRAADLDDDVWEYSEGLDDGEYREGFDWE